MLELYNFKKVKMKKIILALAILAVLSMPMT